MFARMTMLPVQLDKIEEAIRIYKRSVVPAARKQKGHRGTCLLVDRKQGKGISVTFWRTEKDAAANEENLYYQEQLAKFLEVLAGPPIKEGYEIVVHALTPQALPCRRAAARPRSRKAQKKKRRG